MKRVLLICLVALCGPAVPAQVTIDACLRMARENYPLIAQYELVEQLTELSVQNAARAYLPQLKLSAQATYQSDVTSFPEQLESMFALAGVEMHGLNRDQYRVMIDVSQIIWDGGATRAGKEARRAQGEVSQQSIEVELYALGRRVNDLFFGVLLLEAQLAQNDELQRLLHDNSERVTAMIENGVALASDKDAVEVELLTAGQQRTQIETALGVYRKMLALLTGDATVEHATLVKPAYSDVWRQDGVENRPEMRLYDAQLAQIAARRKGVDAQVMPQIGAFAQGFYGNPGLNMFNDMVENRWSWNYIVGVRLQWNISGFYTRKNELSLLDVERRRVENSREVFRFNTALQLTEEQRAVQRMQAVSADDAKIIALRTSIREAAQARMENGVASVSDVLRELAKENNAKITRTIHEIELLKSIYDIKLTRNE